MSELFLIVHKVRGEPAFDVATQMACPLCSGVGYIPEISCVECDRLGYWWIIPTSGHRAYPWWHCELFALAHQFEDEFMADILPMPEDLPDHYQSRAEPSRLAQLKAMLPPAKPIHRRF